MIKENGLKERIVRNIKPILTGFHATKPDQYKAELKALCIESIVRIRTKRGETTLSEMEIQEIKKEIEEEFFQQQKNLNLGHKLNATYSRMYSEYTRIKVMQKNESNADYSERMRYLAFRLLTAIGIAAVILSTSYLANKWDIPLSFIRMAAMPTSP